MISESYGGENMMEMENEALSTAIMFHPQEYVRRLIRSLPQTTLSVWAEYFHPDFEDSPVNDMMKWVLLSGYSYKYSLPYDRPHLLTLMYLCNFLVKIAISSNLLPVRT